MGIDIAHQMQRTCVFGLALSRTCNQAGPSRIGSVLSCTYLIRQGEGKGLQHGCAGVCGIILGGLCYRLALSKRGSVRIKVVRCSY